MKIIDWPPREEAPFAPRGSAIAVGVFDGVHRGHAEILKRVLVLASGSGAEPVCFTFKENPKRLLAPSGYQGDILSLESRLDLIAEAGIGSCVVADFDATLRETDGEEFIRSLRSVLGAVSMVLGENSRLGRGASLASRDAAAYATSLGMASEVVHSLRDGNAVISSRAIREAIREGRLSEAASFLGRPYVIKPSEFAVEPSGAAFRAFQAGRGFALPKAGRYGAVAVLDSGERMPVEVEFLGESRDSRSFLIPAPLPRALEFV